MALSKQITEQKNKSIIKNILLLLKLNKITAS